MTTTATPRSAGARLIDGFEGLLDVCGGLVLMLLMMMTAVDVTARYVFNAPVRGAFELTELTLAVLIFAGLPLVSRHQQHVVVDLLEQRMSPTLRRAFDRIANLVSALVLFGLTRLLWVKAMRLANDGDYTSVLKVPYAPFVYAMAVLVAIAGLVHLVFCLKPPQPIDLTNDTTI